jgi:deoxyribonuclease-4
MEVEFVRGVNMSSESARELRELAIKRRVRLSAHAPYFINLNAREPEKTAASRERIMQTARITALMGGESVVFHPAYYLKDEPSSVYAAVKSNLEQITVKLRAEGIRLLLRPEVMGKYSQFGTLDEVLNLCAEVEGLAPAVDFAHWHARTGRANTYYEFTGILKRIKRKLGSDALSSMHIHVSGIAYGAKGENRHENLDESDFQYEELLRALRYFDAGGMLICESPNLEEDALLLQQIYRKL